MEIHRCDTCNACVPVEKEEHRGSRMPDLLRECASDPVFADAVSAPFTLADLERVREKAERIWAAANGVRR